MNNKKIRVWFQKSLAVVLSVAFLVTSQGATVLASSADSVSQNTSVEISETSVSENEVSDNHVSDNDINEQASDGIGQLPVVLKKELTNEKKQLSATLDGFSDLEAGVDYVADEVLCEVSSYKDAVEVALDYDASVQAVQEGVAVLKISEDVESVLNESISLENDNQPVYPNYIYTLNPIYSEVVESTIEQTQSSMNSASENSASENSVSGNDASIQAISNDPYIKGDTQWYHNLIGSKFAWKQGIRGANVAVAVLDTGISTTHPDLSGKYTLGKSFVPNNSSYEDDQGHGSNVSGIIAASLNNGSGGSGIAPSSTIVPVKVMNSAGSGTTATITQGVRYATTISSVKVMNLSLGGYNQDILYSNAISDATDAGILVVVSAGNENTSSMAYPAGYRDAFAVSAISETKRKSSYSNYGSHIKIAAPGGDAKISAKYSGFMEIRGIISCNMGTGNVTMIGTSQAAPMVSGAAALVYSQYPELRSNRNRTSVSTVKTKLLNSATYIGDAKYYGRGMLNIPKALGISSTVVKPEAKLFYGGKQIDYSKSVVSGTKLSLTHPFGDDAEIYYTLNGKTPRNEVVAGKIYKLSTGGSISLTGGKPITVKAIAYAFGKKSAVVTFTYSVQKGLVSSIAVNTKNEYSYLAKGKSVQMVAAVLPEHAKNKAVTWSVSDKTIAKISSTGVLTGVKTGNVVVTATAKDGSSKLGTKTVSISNPVYSLKLLDTDKKIELNTGQARTLLAPTIISKDTTLGAPAKGVAFKSSNPKVASVDTNGKIIALKTGKAIITVMAKDGTKKYDTSTVNVKTIVSSIAIAADQDNAKVAIGKTRKTKLTFNGGKSKPDNRTVTYASSNPAVAKVSSTGVVTGVSKGSAVITVASKVNPLIKGNLTISVVDITKEITLSIATPTSSDPFMIPSKQTRSKSISCSVEQCKVSGSFGSTGDISLNMNVTPASGTMGKYSYSSSNSKVVSVNQETGKFIVLNNGTATITVKAMDGSGKTASCKIKVKQVINSVALRTSNRTMGVAGGKSLQLSKVTLPYNAGQNAVYFFLDGSKLLTEMNGNKITNSGLLTAKTVSIPTTVNVCVLYNYTITQSWFGKTYNPETYKTYAITIYPATKSIKFATNPGSPIKMTAGTSKDLGGLVFSPSNCQKIAKYTSSNSKVATVDSDGTIRAISKGTATIKVTAIDGSGVSKSTIVKVTN